MKTIDTRNAANKANRISERRIIEGDKSPKSTSSEKAPIETIGANRKEPFITSSLSKFRQTSAAIVTPDRVTPGIMANPCINPTIK